MSKSEVTEIEEEKEIGNIVQQFVCRLPKKNHDAMMEQIFYRDIKHRDEYMATCGNDEDMNQLYKQFMDLITPTSSPIMGEFIRLKV
jgi:hypothetical protein